MTQSFRPPTSKIFLHDGRLALIPVCNITCSWYSHQNEGSSFPSSRSRPGSAVIQYRSTSTPAFIRSGSFTNLSPCSINGRPMPSGDNKIHDCIAQPARECFISPMRLMIPCTATHSYASPRQLKSVTIHERDGWIDTDPSPTTSMSELLIDWTFASLLPPHFPSTMTSKFVARILGNASESWKAVSIVLCFFETRSFHKFTCMMLPPSASMKLSTFLTPREPAFPSAICFASPNSTTKPSKDTAALASGTPWISATHSHIVAEGIVRFPPDTRRFFGVPYSWAGPPERPCACANAASGESFATLASGNLESASSRVKSTALIAITLYRFLIPKMLHSCTCNLELLSTHEILTPTNLTTQTTKLCTAQRNATRCS